jgi:glycosyltransferase involved in cell wall biosynthesis
VGTAVVVSDQCGVASSFGPGEALVVPYDVDATVDAITHVLGDAALRRRLEEGALRAAQRSSWDAVVEEQLALYAEALAG